MNSTSPPTLSSEIELLLLTVRTEITRTASRRVRELVDQGLDWKELVEWAVWHHVMPQLYRVLEAEAGDLVPDELRDAMAENVSQLNALAERSRAVLPAIVDLLSEQGIDSLVFKGPVVAADLYPDPASRVYRDVDLLIPAADVSLAAERMEALGFIGPDALPPAQTRGFRQYAGQYQYYHPERGVVEVHWALIQPMFSIPLDHDRLWTNAREVDIGPRNVRTFGREDTFLHLCAHGAKEHWGRLKWVSDVAHFVRRHPDLRWAEVLTHAEERGNRRIVLLALALAEQFLDEPAPAALRSAIARDSALPELIDRVRARLTEVRQDPPDIWEVSRFLWLARERWRDRITYALRTTLTPWEWHYRLIRLPGWLFWGYYPIRVVTDYIAAPIWMVIKRLRRIPREANGE